MVAPGRLLQGPRAPQPSSPPAPPRLPHPSQPPQPTQGSSKHTGSHHCSRPPAACSCRGCRWPRARTAWGLRGGSTRARRSGRSTTQSSWQSWLPCVRQTLAGHQSPPIRPGRAPHAPAGQRSLDSTWMMCMRRSWRLPRSAERIASRSLASPPCGSSGEAEMRDGGMDAAKLNKRAPRIFPSAVASEQCRAGAAGSSHRGMVACCPPTTKQPQGGQQKHTAVAHDQQAGGSGGLALTLAQTVPASAKAGLRAGWCRSQAMRTTCSSLAVSRSCTNVRGSSRRAAVSRLGTPAMQSAAQQPRNPPSLGRRAALPGGPDAAAQCPTLEPSSGAACCAWWWCCGRSGLGLRQRLHSALAPTLTWRQCGHVHFSSRDAGAGGARVMGGTRRCGSGTCGAGGSGDAAAER